MHANLLKSVIWRHNGSQSQKYAIKRIDGDSSERKRGLLRSVSQKIQNPKAHARGFFGYLELILD